MRPEIYRQMAIGQGQHWWFVARCRILAAVIERLALPPCPDILEIGCGTGGNLAMLAAFGHLHAMEHDSAAREHARTLDLCPIVTGTLPDDIPFDDKTFDLVCLFDVLEHIEQEIHALNRAGGLLKPGGSLLITVPAYAWLWSAHDESHHHHRRYTAAMLRRHAQHTGLIVRRLGYFNSLLFSAIAVWRLCGKASSDAALPPPPLNALLDFLFGLERFVLPFATFPFGLSVIAVLERPR